MSFVHYGLWTTTLLQVHYHTTDMYHGIDMDQENIFASTFFVIKVNMFIETFYNLKINQITKLNIR